MRLASEEKTMKQISFCEEDCEISRTFARTLAVVENVRPTTSGRPTIPGPPTAMSETSRMAVSAFTPALEAAALRRDFCAGMLRLESVANPHGDAGFRHGAQRLGMQHFCAEMRELGSFAIGNFRNGARAGNEARIGGEHAIHIGPDDHFIRGERAARMVAE